MIFPNQIIFLSNLVLFKGRVWLSFTFSINPVYMRLHEIENGRDKQKFVGNSNRTYSKGKNTFTYYCYIKQ